MGIASPVGMLPLERMCRLRGRPSNRGIDEPQQEQECEFDDSPTELPNPQQKPAMNGSKNGSASEEESMSSSPPLEQRKSQQQLPPSATTSTTVSFSSCSVDPMTSSRSSRIVVQHSILQHQQASLLHRNNGSFAVPTSIPPLPTGLLPETSMRQTSMAVRQRLEEMTIDKLQFDRVGLVGREKELQQIRELFHRTMHTSSKTKAFEGIENNATKPQHDQDSNRHNDDVQAPHGSPRHRSLLLIGGSAGSGKSLLAMEALKPIQRGQQEYYESSNRSGVGLPNLLFLHGKHELQQENEPYAAIAMCCHDLCQQLMPGLVQNDNKDEQRFGQHLFSRLQATLGSHVATLANNIHSLRPLLKHVLDNDDKEDRKDGSPATHDSGACSSVGDWDSNTHGAMGNYLEAKQRFHHIFRLFLRVICETLPTVLLVDDLQWCDESSFGLLEHLLKDPDNDQLLIVGTFRPDGGSNQRFAQFQNECQTAANRSTTSETSLTLVNISVGNLPLDVTTTWLVELLSITRAAAMPLAKCVHAKTLGNAFFTVQFLKRLQQLQLLTFNYGTLTWCWNIDKINGNVTATENVADLVRMKMKMLPMFLQQVLPLMASLGFSFHIELFRMVMAHAHTNIWKEAEKASASDPNDDSVLNKCHKEGLIEPQGRGIYRWIHDNVQEAALNLVSIEELENMQFELGSSLLLQMDDHQKKENIFVLVHLFRACSKHLSPDDQRRNMLAKLKLESGLQAFHASAFEQAAIEFDAAAGLLLQNSWKTHYSFCLELCSTAAEANYCIGNLDKVDLYVSEILKHTAMKPIRDRKRVYNVQVRRLIAHGQLSEATDLLLHVLAQLGVKLRKSVAIVLILKKLVQAQKNVNVNAERLKVLPPMSNEMKAWSIFLLDRLSACWYLAKSPLVPLAVLTALEISLKDGICDFASNQVATTGLFMVLGLNNVKVGCKYAQMALEIVDDPNFKHSKCQTFLMCYNMILHNVIPVEETRKGLLHGYQSGMAHGDSEYACWCMSAFLEQMMLSGSKLEPIIRDCSAAFQESEDLQQLPQGYIVLCQWQFCLNMAGRSEDPLVLTGEAMSEEGWVKNNMIGEHWEMIFGRYQIHAAVIMGAYRKAMGTVIKYGFHQNKFEQAFPGVFTAYVLHFHSAIAATSMARQSQHKYQKFFKIAKMFMHGINSWLKAGVGSLPAFVSACASDSGPLTLLFCVCLKQNPNVQHYAALVSAELADLQGDTDQANELFQKAILLSARRGFRQDRAMAHERFGDFHLRQLDLVSAKYQYHEALRMYEEWGARAKVQCLRQLHNDILEAQ